MLDRSVRQVGFSLVEMVVALLFTMILMAGMATVFKSSLSSFVVSGENISSTRRNRLAIDLLSDDLNVAGEYLTLEAPPKDIVDANPGFIVNPGVTFTGTDIPAANAVTDELLFYYDEPLPVVGSFKADVFGVGSYVVSGGSTPANFTIHLGSGPEANAVKAGMMILTRGNYEHRQILAAAPTGQDTVLTINNWWSEKHLATEGVVIARPAQYVRYRIESRNWDPQMPTGVGVPCLVREQGPYPGSLGFIPDDTMTTILAENVSKFTVSLSADHGVTWAAGSSWAAIKTSLNSKLTASGAPGYKSISSSPHWYRFAPILVRVNVTTRTAVQRSEYSAAGNAVTYKEQTQSLLLLPRHFGLNF